MPSLVSGLMAAVLLLGLVALLLSFVTFQLFKQQGRLLLRLDQVERQLGTGPEEAIARGTAALRARAPSGLPRGKVFPPFTLPDLQGCPMSLEDFRGERVLLIHWNARCSFCDLIAPDLASAQEDLLRAKVRMLLISPGEAKAEREMAERHGLGCPVLLYDGRAGLEAFQGVGTPAAYLLDEKGRTALPLALGAEQVPKLLREIVPARAPGKRLPGMRPLSESRIERDGLKAGTPAPGFTLPEIRGGEISLEQYRGRKLLLVFSDPHCGPCDQLAPHLASLQRMHRNNGLDVLIVSRGDPEENLAKAGRLGLDCPVVLQHGWSLSRRYGIFATPVGFLIGEDGVIVKDVAKGNDQIMALASQVSAFGKDS